MYIQVCLCSSRWSSGVGNKVYSWLFVVVLNEVLPRQALKVHPWGSLVIDRVVRGLLVNSALGLREAEVLVRGLIRCFVVESIRVERGNRELVDTFLHADRLVADLRHLVRRERLLVLRVAAEGQRVDRVLRVLLMEHICVSVLPVGVVHFVRTVQLHGPFAQLVVEVDQVCPLAEAAVVHLALRSLQVHLVGVDDLRFLLEVERAFVVLCKGALALELLLVVAVGFGGVRVAHKAVVAARLAPIQVVSNRHLLEGAVGGAQVASRRIL